MRAKIQCSQLINRLMSHINGEVELSNTQVRSIEILMNKSLPDLASMKMDVSTDQIQFNIGSLAAPVQPEPPKEGE